MSNKLKSTCANNCSVAKTINKKETVKKVVDTKVNSPTTCDVENDSEEASKEKFESELRWCIGKLQTLMSTPNTSQKQIEVRTKALAVLIDPKAPLIKKRSVMRTCLGDYRAQMKVEEQKYIKESKNMKVVAVTRDKQKGTYFRKCSDKSTKDTEQTVHFRFDFPLNDK